jgi:recombination protein RecR
MSPSLEKLQQALKQLPGLGYRSAERIALHLIVEKPERRAALVEALEQAAARLTRCSVCGNLCERDTGDGDGVDLPETAVADDSQGPLCPVCTDPRRDGALVCVVEQVTDLLALEKSGAWRGRYHVLYGKLSPIQGVGEADLNMRTLRARIEGGQVKELILALSNDIEGEATCHYIQQEIAGGRQVNVSRIGFGLPSGGGINFADPTTLRSAIEGRRKI